MHDCMGLHQKGCLLSFALLWIPVTLAAALTQTARNATQRALTAKLGVIGATQVRFLYGFPFALLFLALVSFVYGRLPPAADLTFLLWVLIGSVGQIVATGLMLAAMQDRSFAVTIAYTKTEPMQVAIFAALVIGDPLSLPKFLAIMVASAGVILMSWRKTAVSSTEEVLSSGSRSAILGITSGTFFAISAIGFRAAILILDPEAGFLHRATTTLAWSLGTQTALLGAYLLVANRKALLDSLGVWRQSLKAGFLGTLASQFWFLGFALTSAANVRTLALVEVLFAQVVSRRFLAEGQSWRELIGMALVVIGVGWILWLAV
jgi:drug/metabolite transporter (DMT)-like permease